jgi:hypothetical protein
VHGVEQGLQDPPYLAERRFGKDLFEGGLLTFEKLLDQAPQLVFERLAATSSGVRRREPMVLPMVRARRC